MSKLKSTLLIDQHWAEGLPRPLLIAGPCSAENRLQIESTYSSLKSVIWGFRFGTWKPRSRPGHFEGMGASVFDWVKNLKNTETGPYLCTEVADATQAKMCMEQGFKVVWLGARTTVNPFLVDDIAKVLAPYQPVVMVKNPLAPDLSLWIGALERLNRYGLNKLIAVHRGFTTYHSRPYRNEPVWPLLLQLKLTFPQLPLLCDPSHLSGQRQYIEKLSLTAFKLGADGLMVEVHPCPQAALSDASQQITPLQMQELWETVLRQFANTHSSKISEVKIGQAREVIDQLDFEIIEKLKMRMEWVQKISSLKKEVQMSSLQIDRYRQLIQDRIEWGNTELSPQFIEDLFAMVHQYALALQVPGLNSEDSPQIEQYHALH